MSTDLYSSAVLAKPVDRDWSNPYDENGDELWQSYEAETCEECGWVTVCTPGAIDCGEGVAVFSPDGEEWDREYADEDEAHPCGSRTLYPEGPMMNYAYPLGERSFSPSDAAKLAHLPLALVDIEGDWFLALTGGGMDLSWEICAGHVALGYLPPAHFAGGLVSIGDMGNREAEWFAPTLAAARESLSRAVTWATNDLERFVGKYGAV